MSGQQYRRSRKSRRSKKSSRRQYDDDSYDQLNQNDTLLPVQDTSRALPEAFTPSDGKIAGMYLRSEDVAGQPFYAGAANYGLIASELEAAAAQENVTLDDGNANLATREHLATQQQNIAAFANMWEVSNESIKPVVHVMPGSNIDEQHGKKWRNVAARGRLPKMFWPFLQGVDFYVRAVSGGVFAIAAILVLIFTLTGSFDVETRLTTDFLTSGQTPTSANGFIYTVGTVKWGWFVFSSFALCAAVHFVTASSLIFKDSYHRYIVEYTNNGFDPTKIGIFVCGWAVMGLVFAFAVGVSNILMLVLLFLALVAFGYHFVFIQEYTYSKQARTLGYALISSVSHSYDEDGRYKVVYHNMNGNVSDGFSMSRMGPYIKVGSLNGMAAAGPQRMANCLAIAISGSRWVSGVPPALEGWKTQLQGVQPAEPFVGMDPSVYKGGNVTAVHEEAIIDLSADLLETIVHRPHFVAGWVLFAAIVSFYSVYMAYGLHQTSFNFEPWVYAVYALYVFALLVYAWGYHMFWRAWPMTWLEKYNILHVSITDHTFATIFLIAIGFTLIGAPHNTGLIY